MLTSAEGSAKIDQSDVHDVIHGLYGHASWIFSVVSRFCSPNFVHNYFRHKFKEIEKQFIDLVQIQEYIVSSTVNSQNLGNTYERIDF